MAQAMELLQKMNLNFCFLPRSESPVSFSAILCLLTSHIYSETENKDQASSLLNVIILKTIFLISTRSGMWPLPLMDYHCLYKRIPDHGWWEMVKIVLPAEMRHRYIVQGIHHIRIKKSYYEKWRGTGIAWKLQGRQATQLQSEKIVYKLAFSGLNSHRYFWDYKVFETLFTTHNKVWKTFLCMNRTISYAKLGKWMHND